MQRFAKHQPSPRRRGLLILAAGLVLALLVAGSGLLGQWWFEGRAVTPPGSPRVDIPLGTALPQVAARLAAAGVISDEARFVRLARRSEAGQKIKAGSYRFTVAATPREVLDRLVAGDVIKIRLTIPEGFTLRDIAARVEAAGIGTADQFLAAAGDPALRRRLAIPFGMLEGYLFPETYTLTAMTTPAEVVRTMVAQLEHVLTADLLAAARARGLDRHRLLTLASIVQKEAGSEAEMPQIAAVFHNRLRLGMPLQADPTVIYGIPAFDGNLTRRHLTTPTPYNTYTRKGLPPGPIASPGLAALRAAAFPADSPALYFVADGHGRHIFSTTLDAHNRAVNRYQRRRG